MSDEKREEGKKRFSIKKVKQHWKESLQKWREGGDPYIDGERNKVSDIFLGFFLMIGGILVGFGPVLLIFMFTGDPGSAGILVLLITVIPLLIMAIYEFKLMVRFLKKNHYYIFIGMIGAILIGLSLIIIALMVEFIYYIIFYSWCYWDHVPSILVLLGLLFGLLFLLKKFLKNRGVSLRNNSNLQ